MKGPQFRVSPRNFSVVHFCRTCMCALHCLSVSFSGVGIKRVARGRGAAAIPLPWRGAPGGPRPPPARPGLLRLLLLLLCPSRPPGPRLADRLPTTAPGSQNLELSTTDIFEVALREGIVQDDLSAGTFAQSNRMKVMECPKSGETFDHCLHGKKDMGYIWR